MMDINRRTVYITGQKVCPEVPFHMVIIIFTINESFMKGTSPEHEPAETQSVPLTSETGVRARTRVSLLGLRATLHNPEIFHYPKDI